MDPKELRRQAGQLVTEARAVAKVATDAKRAMSKEESEKFDRLHDEAEAKLTEARRLERSARLEQDIGDDPTGEGGEGGDPDPAADPNEGRRSRSGDPSADDPERRTSRPQPLLIGGTDYRSHPRASEHYVTAYRAWLRDGREGLMELPQEVRAGLQADLFKKGGALQPPMQFLQNLIKDIDDQVFIRTLATMNTVTSAEALGAPTLDADPADPDWTSELKTGSETDMDFGRRELRPHPLAKEVKASKKLIRMVPGIEALVRGRLAYKFGVALEKGYLTGDGVRKPLGLFTASDDGIPTSRDVATDNTTTNITADGLIEAKHFLKPGYWAAARWAFSRELVKRARKLKDANGQYIWQPGLSADLPNRILEIPYFISEFVPNTFTAGAYVGIIGDFTWYWIVDALTTEIQRLDELYAKTNQVGFIGRFESDGQPVLAEAFVRVTLAP